MISIGVVTIGLVGVLAIMPLAGRRASQGIVEDGKSLHGLSWVEEFHTRGYTNPNSWRYSDGSQVNGISGSVRPYMIDPQFIAANGGGTNASTAFPFTTTGTPMQMRRISVWSNPQGSPPGVLNALGARSIFASQNDLSFQQAADSADPPVQQFFNTNAKRISDGRFSWMAMVTPTDASGQEWKLSVVVFHSRDPAFSNASSANPALDDDDNLANERIAQVTDMIGQGVNGGPMEITGQILGDVKVNKGEWVLLSATASQPYNQTHQWYRVVDVDTELIPSAGFTREITLSGPDWPVNSAGTTPQVTMVKGVVGVFEKTFRFEHNSIF